MDPLTRLYLAAFAVVKCAAITAACFGAWLCIAQLIPLPLSPIAGTFVVAVVWWAIGRRANH